MDLLKTIDDATVVDEKILKYESFVNDVLKEDLRIVHDKYDRTNREIGEWLQLKRTINGLKDVRTEEGFKTKTDVGTDVYVQVVVPDPSKILVDVGSGVYVEYTEQEALRFIDKRLELLEKQVAIVKKDSAKIKSRIKLVLHGIRELSNIK